MQDNDFTTILAWPGFRVFQHQINEGAHTLRLWVRPMRRSRPLICSGCGERVRDVVDASEREMDLPRGEDRTTVVVKSSASAIPTVASQSNGCRSCRAKRPSA